ncbi:MAG: 2-phosphosulfolactate phosphatase [Pleurocapsa sp. MO_226.B13]|nr:2-phosphosulfolactate phosphatase [Pleurocapsa sp. MO_226.B13]
MYFNQNDFEIRCEWGKSGILQLAPFSDVIVIVDVLSFSTCIEIATSLGAIVYPYQWQDESAKAFADSKGAKLAKKRGSNGYSLSPVSLTCITAGTRLVLPSPNGSSLSLATTSVPILAGCLRNCQAVAFAAMKYGRKIAVIPAGEQWEDNTLRPSFEDFIGAGAIISYLQGSLSPEAQLAMAAYQGVRKHLSHLVKQCGSGKELITRGFAQDVDLAAELNVSNCVPTLIDGAYVYSKKRTT